MHIRNSYEAMPPPPTPPPLIHPPRCIRPHEFHLEFQERVIRFSVANDEDEGGGEGGRDGFNPEYEGGVTRG